MTLDEIATLDVHSLADPAGARLFLWTTNRYLPDAFPIMARWGFQYRQTIVWHKVNGSPFVASIAPNHAEYLIVGTFGDVPRLTPLASSVVSIKHNAKVHSRKPECFLDYIEQVSPGPYVELFARRTRFGWDTWGNEALAHVEIASAGERC